MVNKRLIIKNNHGRDLVGYYRKNTSDTILIYCHGVESFTAIPAESLNLLWDTYFSIGISLFRFDFTGYGESEGDAKATHQQRVNDIGSVIEFFKKKYKKIILAGISLGGIDAAIASLIYPEVTKLYLVNGVYEVKLLNIQVLIPFLLQIAFDVAIRNDMLYIWKHFRPERITVPTLVIVGEKDEIVNPKQSYNLYKRLKNNKKLVVIANGDHALLDPSYLKDYREQIRPWFFQ